MAYKACQKPGYHYPLHWVFLSLSLSVPTVTSLLDVPFFRVEQAFEKMYIFAKEMIKKIEGMLVNLANAKWLCYIACTFGATFA